MEKFIMVDGIPVRYADFGKGPQAVLLLHGYLEAIEVWEEFAGQLGKRYRVLLVDLPGHGFTGTGGRDTLTMDFMADVVAGTLARAGVERCVVVGHSMGGYVALALAENHPALVEKLVLFHSSPNADTPEKAANRQREIEIVQADRKELLATTNPGKGFAPDNLRRCAETIAELGEQIMMMENEAIVAALRGMAARPDRNAAMRRMGVPQLMIFGRNDQYIPAEAAAAIAAGQPQASVVWLEGSGHMGFVEQPEESFERLSDFLG